MRPSEFPEFSAEVRRLATVFRVRMAPAEMAGVADAYFHALKRFPLQLLTAKADAWIGNERQFPKPAEWGAVVVRSSTADVTALTDDEAAAYQRAEGLRWEDHPCLCHACVHASVDERPLRFVPDLDADGRDIHARFSDRLVARGHWAHGDELARWYEARANFYNRCLELGLRRTDSASGVPIGSLARRHGFPAAAPKRTPEQLKAQAAQP